MHVTVSAQKLFGIHCKESQPINLVTLLQALKEDVYHSPFMSWGSVLSFHELLHHISVTEELLDSKRSLKEFFPNSLQCATCQA